MTSIIRLLTPQDIPAVKTIAAQTELFPPDMVDELTSGYLDQSSDVIWFVSDDGTTQAFGYCAPEPLTDGTWNLLALAVDPAEQSNGIGTTMVQWIESHLRAQDARLLLIETADVAEFARQRQFYSQNGYTQIAHIPQYYDQTTGRVTFVKSLRIEPT